MYSGFQPNQPCAVLASVPTGKTVLLAPANPLQDDNEEDQAIAATAMQCAARRLMARRKRTLKENVKNGLYNNCSGKPLLSVLRVF